ncbi:MAG: hypothetical protein FWD52_06040 [Candidatus Bathyarchaeota archaeon]|nr:hypothetical protein [Candidatus Termiticorpusculum sp.]
MINAKNGAIDSKHVDFNHLVVPNSNHFTCAKLAMADLSGECVEFILVVGNKFVPVGVVVVKMVDD